MAAARKLNCQMSFDLLLVIREFVSDCQMSFDLLLVIREFVSDRNSIYS